MSKVWFAIPTANAERCAKTFEAWRAMGYSTAALVDGETPDIRNADLCVRLKKYRGYAQAVNLLCDCLKNAEWVVTGGDDVLCDPKHRAEDIGDQCAQYFGGTTGVMQPCGDPYGALADRSAAVSPWMGREFRREINLGRGPLWPAYEHYWVDTELAAVCEGDGLMLWRDDLVQYHDHHLRRGDPKPQYLLDKEPSAAAGKILFERRKAMGFPGSERVSLVKT